MCEVASSEARGCTVKLRTVGLELIGLRDLWTVSPSALDPAYYQMDTAKPLLMFLYKATNASCNRMPKLRGATGSEDAR